MAEDLGYDPSERHEILMHILRKLGLSLSRCQQGLTVMFKNDGLHSSIEVNSNPHAGGSL